MSGFDFGNIGAMMAGFQQRMAAMKEKAASTRCVGESGGGMVKITLTGDYQIVDLTIDPKAMDDREMLEDRIAVAFNDAARKVETTSQEKMAGVTAGLPLPPGMKLPF